MLFWAPDSRLNPVGKLKPPSWERQSEEEQAGPRSLYTTMWWTGLPGVCIRLRVTARRERHTATVTLLPSPLAIPSTGNFHCSCSPAGTQDIWSPLTVKARFSPLLYLSRLPVDRKRFSKRASADVILLIVLGFLSFNSSKDRWQPDRPGFCQDQSVLFQSTQPEQFSLHGGGMKVVFSWENSTTTLLPKSCCKVGKSKRMMLGINGCIDNANNRFNIPSENVYSSSNVTGTWAQCRHVSLKRETDEISDVCIKSGRAFRLSDALTIFILNSHFQS